MGIILKNFVEEHFETLKLPSSLWSTHVDPEFEFVVILHVDVINLTKVIFDRSILLTEENNNIKQSTFLNNKLVHLSFAQKAVSDITELSNIINIFHNLKKCPNYNKEKCNRFIIYENCDLCNFCSGLPLFEKIGPDEIKVKMENKTSIKRAANDSNDNDYSSIFGDSDDDMYSIIELKHKEREKSELADEDTEAIESSSEAVYNDIIIIEESEVEYDDSRGKVFICTVCKDVFEDQYLYQEHIKTHSTPDASKNTSLCNICGFVFKNHAIKEHIESHSAEFKHICTTCGKRFPKKESLRIHLKLHLGTRPYQCKDCNKTYKTSSCLRTHELSVHNKEARKYKCDTCSMTFVHPHLMKLHNRIHTGEKPYECEFCDKRFTKNIHLTVHTRTHTGEKPHPCELCGKAFTTTGNLKSHKKTRHKMFVTS